MESTALFFTSFCMGSPDGTELQEAGRLERMGYVEIKVFPVREKQSTYTHRTSMLVSYRTF